MRIFENSSIFTFCSSKVWPIFVLELWFFLKKNWKFSRFWKFGGQVLFLQGTMEFLNQQKGHTLEIERTKSDEKAFFDLKKVLFFFQFFFNFFSPINLQNLKFQNLHLLKPKFVEIFIFWSFFFPFFSIFSPSIFQNYFSWTQRKQEVAKDDKRQHTVSTCGAPVRSPGGKSQKTS